MFFNIKIRRYVENTLQNITHNFYFNLLYNKIYHTFYNFIFSNYFIIYKINSIYTIDSWFILVIINNILI